MDIIHFWKKSRWNITTHLVTDVIGGFLIYVEVVNTQFTFDVSTPFIVPGLISDYGSGLFREEWNYKNVGRFVASNLLSAIPGGAATKLVKISSLPSMGKQIHKVASGTSGATFINGFINLC